MGTIIAIPKSSRLDSTVSALSALIFTGTVGSGDLLPPEAELCKQLQVSRPTVREAIRILQSRGLVVSEHGVGIRVIDRTEQVASASIARMIARKGSSPQDVLEVRLAIECQSAALAAKRATSADIDVILATIEKMADTPGEPDQNAQLDFEFHLRVAEASHNPILLMLVNTMSDVLFDTISATHALNPSLDIRLMRHTQVLFGIQQHDPERALQAMREHLEETRELVDLVEITGSYVSGGTVSTTS